MKLEYQDSNLDHSVNSRALYQLSYTPVKANQGLEPCPPDYETGVLPITPIGLVAPQGFEP